MSANKKSKLSTFFMLILILSFCPNQSSKQDILLVIRFFYFCTIALGSSTHTEISVVQNVLVVGIPSWEWDTALAFFLRDLRWIPYVWQTLQMLRNSVDILSRCFEFPELAFNLYFVPCWSVLLFVFSLMPPCCVCSDFAVISCFFSPIPES